MVPEELLTTLLDSRTPNPSESGDIRSDPTGVRVLQSLALGQRGVTTIAEEAAISRQTVYRVLTRYRHAGLVRSETGRCVISCTGTGLLRVYEEARPGITSEELSQLARSHHRRWVLARLDDAPSRKAELVGGEDGVGPSRSTVHRIVESLLGDGCLEHRGDGYALTGRGSRLRETYATLRDTAAQAIDKRAFFQWLPGELDEFPITAVDDATLIRNHPDQPHNVLDTYVRAADPALDRFRGMSAVLSPTLTQAYRPMMDGGTDLRAVCSENLLFAFHRDPEFIDCVRESGYAAFLRGGFVSGSSVILFVPESFPLQVGIYDDHRIIISPTPATGVSEEELAAIDSTDPVVLSWVQAYFESYYERGRTPLAVFLSRLD